jgi:hypothetical protein
MVLAGEHRCRNDAARGRFSPGPLPQRCRAGPVFADAAATTMLAGEHRCHIDVAR